LPLSQSYVYRAELVANCQADPLLTVGDDVVGVLSTSSDGRERVVLTFATGPDRGIATDLLGYGLLRWVTRGVFLGELRHWLNVDVDDWFNASAIQRPDGSQYTYRLTGPEVPAIAAQQADLRRRYPLAGNFMLNMAYNGGRLDRTAPAQCDADSSPDPLTSYTLCLKDEFRWINHTLTHPQMNFTDYARNYTEIADNIAVATQIGLPVPPTVLKTPEYSGLGVYSPTPNTLDPPIDHGLEESNTALLEAASDLGIEYVVGNFSYKSMQPDCFNCGIEHPLQPDLFVVPAWTTYIAFVASKPDEQVAAYNFSYGEPAHPDSTYDQVIDQEAHVAFTHISSGSVYTHTLHQANLRQYASGRSLAFDWLDAVLAKYSTYYSVPLNNPDWLMLARYVQARNSHFAAIRDNRDDAVWNRATGAVSYTPERDGSVFITGLATRPATDTDQSGPDSAQLYGSDAISRVDAKAGQTLAVAVEPRA
jgi:hypothetical protein